MSSQRLQLLLAMVIVTLARPTSAAPAKQSFNDDAITAAVKSDLRFGNALFPSLPEVSTSRGIVTLSGSVDNVLVRRRAVTIAESVRGVLGVIDRLTVTPEPRDDESVHKDILMALLDDPATESYQVAVTVRDGIVTLTGSVGSQAESQLAQHLAEGVQGVKAVRNQLVINYAEKRIDPEIAADIQATLGWDIWVRGYPIQVEVKDGAVRLTGTVRSAIVKSRANADAWVHGVLAVQDNGLKVDPTASAKLQRRRKTGVWPDGAIKKAVEASLRDDPRASHYAIDVAVEDGVVILDGTVGYLKAKTAAGQDARDVVGVGWVDNELTVRPDMSLPSDGATEKGLKAALRWDPLLAGAPIEVAVLNHIAYLGGSVDSVEQGAEAQDVASRTKGVIIVRNHLKIGPGTNYFFYGQGYNDFETFGPAPPKIDAQIRKDIERAFFWSPFVDRADINVTVHDGLVTLTGTVGSWMGYGEADRDARKSGAVDVLNRLKVR